MENTPTSKNRANGSAEPAEETGPGTDQGAHPGGDGPGGRNRAGAESRGRVLVVEDDADARDLISHLLRREGHDVVPAAGGAEALALLREVEVDVILLDVMMPEVDGLEVCRRLQQSPDLATIPVVLLTALDDMETRAAGMRLGVSEFLTKPIVKDELHRRVATQVGVRRREATLDRVRTRLDSLEG
ncbi:response regulator [bacterium]|nr:response regulator [bacterium]